MRRKKWTTVLLVFLFLVGLSLMLYPTFSNYWNSSRQSKAIVSYVETINLVDVARREEMWQEAVTYNELLSKRSNPYTLSPELRASYFKLLDSTGTGIMGYVEIPSINVMLPIYHGTAESILQTSIGHIEWTHLPVGGTGTHSAISGHRGLPSAKLFTDLDRLVTGDIFLLQILDQTLTYEVDQVLIVEPTDAAALIPTAGEDYCTLETCTPYGVNSHRMLVRGHRIENPEEAKTMRIVSEAIQIEPMIVAPVLGVPLLLLLLIWISVMDVITSRRKKKKKAIKSQLDMTLRR